jgi:hypothetical protein
VKEGLGVFHIRNFTLEKEFKEPYFCTHCPLLDFASYCLTQSLISVLTVHCLTLPPTVSLRALFLPFSITIIFIYLLGWSATESTISESTYWPIIPAWMMMMMMMMMIVEQSMESVGETEVLGENLPQGCFIHHKSRMTTRAGD